MTNSHRTICCFVVFALTSAPAHLKAQSKKSCHILCAPAFSLRTELHRSHVADHRRVQNLTTGGIARLPSKNNPMLLFLTSIATQLPRVALLFNVSWLSPAVRASRPSTSAVGPFTALAKKSWLHDVRLSGNLDWVATGLPKRGDELPKGERVFLDRAKGITMSFGLVLPMAPIP